MPAEMSHSDALKHFINGLRESENAARIIAHYRQSPHWVGVASGIGLMLEKAMHLERQRTSSILLPPGYAPHE